MPAGFTYSAVAYLLVSARPERATTLAALQLLLTIGFMTSFARNFAQRQRLISACTVEENR